MPNFNWKKITIGGMFLFLVGLCCNFCYPQWLFYLPGGRAFYYERLDEVLGEAELIVEARYGVRSVGISPDGQWLMAQLNPAQPHPTLLVDLEKREFYWLDIQTTAIVWLDNQHAYSIDPPKIFRVPDMVWWQLEYRDPDFDSLDKLTNADHIFALDNDGYSVLLTTNTNLPYYVNVNWDGEELEANLISIPHTTICLGERCLAGPRLDVRARYDSPDGRYYVANARHPTENIGGIQPVIFDAQTEQRVAHIYKQGWWLRDLGWAGDSSGAYFELHQNADILDITIEAHPIYKLLVPGATPGPSIKEVPLPPGSGPLQR